MTPNERAGLLGEVRRLLGVPVGDVYRRTPLPGELAGPAPAGAYRRPHWWFVYPHPACPVGESCGCPREVRMQPHRAPRHVGPTGLLRNPRRLTEMFGATAGREFVAADGHTLVRLLRKITNEGQS